MRGLINRVVWALTFATLIAVAYSARQATPLRGFA